MSSRQILLGRYHVLSSLGKGASGEVFKVADSLAPGRVLAAKTFSPPVLPARLEQIRAEFRALSSLSHPNILKAHDLHAVPGTEPYLLTCELVAGRPLLEAAHDLPWRAALALFRPLCAALHYLHSQGMVHRDISSSNILVEQTPASPRPVLMDLGMAGRGGLRLGGRKGGTLHYLSPEVLDGQTAGVAADLYALGVLLYRILSGRFPFTGATLPELEASIRRSEPAPLAETAPQLPSSLCGLVERSLRAEPDLRFPDAAALWQALQPYSGLDCKELDLSLPSATTWPLAGGKQAMARITAAVDRLALLNSRRPARQMQVILLSGPPGSGKSRLLREATRYAQLAGLPAVLMAGRPGQETPLSLMAELLQTLLPWAACKPEARQEYAALQEAYQDLIQCLAPDVEARGPRQDSTAQVLVLEKQIPSLLARLSVIQPFVLAVDDLEAADTASARCLDQWLRQEEGACVLLLTGRHERIQDLASMASPDSRATHLQIPPLRPSEIAALLPRISARFRDTESMATELYRISCGRPAFLAATLKQLFQTVPPAEQVGVSHLQEMDLPPSIRAWVVAQLSRATPVEMALLQVLAVAQEGVAPADLHSLLPSHHSQPSVQTAMRSILKRRLAVQQEDSHRADLCITHPLVRTMVLEQMDQEQGRRLHGQLADLLLAQSAGSEPARADLLSSHLLKAGRLAEAARWAVTAGNTAFAARQVEEAARLYRTALTHLAPEDRELRRGALQHLGRILADLCQFQEATEMLETLIREAGEARDLKHLALGLSGLARVQFRKFQYDAAEALSRRALKIARQLDDPDTEATILWVLGFALQHQSRLHEAKAVYGEMVALRQALHDRSGEAIARYNMAFICHAMRRFPEAMEHLKRTATIHRETGNLFRLSNTLSALGATEIDRGNLLEARSRLEEALRVARKAGARLSQGLALSNLGGAHLRLGQFSAAGHHLDRSRPILKEIEGGRYGVDTALQQGRLWIATGAYRQAEKALQESVELAQRIQDRTYLAEALAGRATVYRLQGDTASARSWCQKGQELASEVADPKSLAVCLTELGFIAHEEEKATEACERLIEARSLGREVGDGDREHLAALGLARVFLSQNRLSQAATLLEPALERAETAGLAADLPVILLLKALLQLRAGDQPAGQDCLKQALRLAAVACPADTAVEIRQLCLALEPRPSSRARRLQRQLDAQVRSLALSIHGTTHRRAFLRRIQKRQRQFQDLVAGMPRPQQTGGDRPDPGQDGCQAGNDSPPTEMSPEEPSSGHAPPDVSSAAFLLASLCPSKAETARLRSLLNLLVDRAIHASRSRRGGLFLLLHASTKNPPAEAPQPVVLRNLERESLASSAALSGSILRAVLEKQQPLTAAQLLADPARAAALTSRVRALPAILAVPVPAGPGGIRPLHGALYLDRHQSGPPYETADLQAVRPLARQIGEILTALQDGEPCRPTEILQSVESILDREVPVSPRHSLSSSRGARFGDLEIIGRSPAMQAVFRLTQRLAGSRAPVLIVGETGTGKELIARALHEASSWAGRRLVAVDCGALNESMAEAELFGHLKGAFSGAHESRTGLLRTADGGTLFLDELGNLSRPVQLKLLRVLESGEVRPVGSDRTYPVTIRLVAATNADLAAQIDAGQFRRDLYHRLLGGLIQLPPLRERMEDLPLLVEQFLKQLTREATSSEAPTVLPRLSPAAWTLLHRHSWPGNVRELRLALQVALSMAGGQVVEACHLPATVALQTQAALPGHPLPGPESTPALTGLPLPTALEGKMVLQVLTECGWDKAAAARRIGWSRQKLYRVMKKYAIPTRLPEDQLQALQDQLQGDRIRRDPPFLPQGSV